MKPVLTVTTPAYNRGYPRHLCYESLCRQSKKSFMWVITDVGSTDNTRVLVEQWVQNETGREIRYVHKETGGMHPAHNKAYDLKDTELNACFDSDDYKVDVAVGKIWP